jgi:hypothetical protein
LVPSAILERLTPPPGLLVPQLRQAKHRVSLEGLRRRRRRRRWKAFMTFGTPICFHEGNLPSSYRESLPLISNAVEKAINRVPRNGWRDRERILYSFEPNAFALLSFNHEAR